MAPQESWKQTFLHEDARQEIMDYLSTIKKPRKFTVKQLVQRIKTMARHAHFMPFPIGEPAPRLSNIQLKKCHLQERS